MAGPSTPSGDLAGPPCAGASSHLVSSEDLPRRSKPVSPHTGAGGLPSIKAPPHWHTDVCIVGSAAGPSAPGDICRAGLSII